MKYLLLIMVISIQKLLYAGTGSARDEGFFYLFIIGVLGLIVGILYLTEFLTKRITRFFEELVSKNEYRRMKRLSL